MNIKSKHALTHADKSPYFFWLPLNDKGDGPHKSPKSTKMSLPLTSEEKYYARMNITTLVMAEAKFTMHIAQ